MKRKGVTVIQNGEKGVSSYLSLKWLQVRSDLEFDLSELTKEWTVVFFSNHVY